MQTVVAIDDDIDDLVILKDTLDEIDSDIRFVSFKSGPAAVEWLKKNSNEKPNLVLIDFNMPNMNGLECLAQLRKMPALESSKLAILSTNIAHIPADRTKFVPPPLTIQKPNSFRAYIKLLKKLLDKQD